MFVVDIVSYWWFENVRDGYCVSCWWSGNVSGGDCVSLRMLVMDIMLFVVGCC